MILSQNGKDRRLHPVVFHSQKFIATKINYEIHDKEFLAIDNPFHKWRHFFEGTVHPISVYIEYKNLEYFMSAQVLNQRQACWNISLPHFNFIITYHPTSQHGQFDALSRRSYFIPKEGDATYDQ